MKKIKSLNAFELSSALSDMASKAAWGYTHLLFPVHFMGKRPEAKDIKEITVLFNNIGEIIRKYDLHR